MNFCNEHIHHKTHHLNLDAVESLKLTEKMKGRKWFPFFTGCISFLHYFFLPFVWGGAGCCVVRYYCSISFNLICFCQLCVSFQGIKLMILNLFGYFWLLDSVTFNVCIWGITTSFMKFNLLKIVLILITCLHLDVLRWLIVAQVF